MIYFRIFILIISLGIYTSVLVPADHFWAAAIISNLIPFVILYHGLIVVFSIGRSFKKRITNLIALALGYPFIAATLGLSMTPQREGHFDLLTYNVHGYRNTMTPSNGEARQQFYLWTFEHPADIKVFQEFYVQIGDEKNDTYEWFRSNGYQGYFEPLTFGTRFHQIGLAIFSRYPIVNSGRLLPVDVKKGNLNNIIFADIAIESDTIRVYNAHFQSMGIDPDHVMETEQLKNEYANVGKKFLVGARERAMQFRIAFDHARSSPHPVIFAGDFNEFPHAYGYMKFRRAYQNAFEKLGRGFGFTMNNRLWFLRIDNVFYDKAFLTPRRFSTRHDVKYSDHFPVEVSFDLNSRRLPK